MLPRVCECARVRGIRLWRDNSTHYFDYTLPRLAPLPLTRFTFLFFPLCFLSYLLHVFFYLIFLRLISRPNRDGMMMILLISITILFLYTKLFFLGRSFFVFFFFF